MRHTRLGPRVMGEPDGGRAALPGDDLAGGGYLSVADLLRRGWSRTLIRRTLGAPCGRARNPHAPTSAPVQLYALERIRTAERAPDFPRMAAGVALARARGLRAVAPKMEALHAWAAAVDLPDLKLSGAAPQVFDSGADPAGQLTLTFASSSPAPDALLRALVECCEPLLWEIDKLFGAPGVRRARSVLRKRLLAHIAATYPNLREACERRFVHERGAPEWGG